MIRPPCPGCGLPLPEGASSLDEDAVPACQAEPPRPSRLPFLLGVYLATNAIPDAATVVDGPDCLFFKAEFVHGKHDLRSTLLDVGGHHRILPSHVTTDDVATSRGERVAALVAHTAALPAIDLVLITSLPMVTIIGTQYAPLLRELRPTAKAELVEVRGRSLEADWIGGYEDVLLALADRIEPAEVLDGESVSVIGYLMDRNEEDHLGNLRELERLVTALGLKLETVWLSGRPWAELTRANRSATLLALPMGRAAAARIAERSGARVLEVDTPFGPGRTAALLRQLAAASGRTEAAEALIDRELSTRAPKLEWIVPQLFVGRRVAFIAPPDLLVGFTDLASELGLEVVVLGSPASRPAWFDDPPSPTERTVAPRFDLETSAACHHLRDDDIQVDLVVANSEILRQLPFTRARVELGYPCYSDHALFDRPYLGFRGWLCFVQRMATALAMTPSDR